MGGGTFDALTRRASFMTLGAAGLAVSLVSPFTVDAKRKGKKKRKRRRKAPSPSPPLSGPVTTVDATCSTASTYLGGADRFAQTFVAQRSGHLTSASVMLVNSAAGANFVLEIRAVDQAGTPSTILAGTTIVNVPATPVGQTQAITGSFGSPAAVVEGQRYALVVTVTPSQGYGLQVGENDPCPNGHLFRDIAASETFDPFPNHDLVFTTFVTA